MSNSHAKKNTKKDPVSGFFGRFRFYPDFGSDSEGFDLSLIPVGVTGLGAVLLIGTSFFSEHFPLWLTLSLYALALFCSSLTVLLNLAYCCSRGRFLCETLPVILACLITFAIGYHRTPTVAMLLYVLFKFFESVTDRRTHEKANGVLSILPDFANVLMEDGTEIRRKPKHLLAGDVALVRRGEIVPVDGEVLEGYSSVDYSRFFNVPEAQPAGVGSYVRSGGVNAGADLVIRADRDYNDSTAHTVYSSFSAAVNRKTEYVELATKIWNILVPAVFGLVILFSVIIPLFTRNTEEITVSPWFTGLRKGAVILLCCCPAGLLNVLELFNFSAVREIFSAGLVLSDSRLLGKLSRLETFVCNKTGTVTTGVYSVKAVIPNGYSSENPPQKGDKAVDRLLQYALRAEGTSSHPIALAIKSYCGSPDYVEYEGIIANEIPGRGVEAFIGSDTVYCGNAALLYDHGINTPVPDMPGTAIHVAYNDGYLGYIILNDEPRHGNYDALECLRSCGVKNQTLISSDLRSIVRPVASYAGFSNVKSELTPEGKIRAVEYLTGARPPKRYVAFLGNGHQELETGRKADICVLTGALWDDAAWNGADVAVLREGITSFPKAVSAASSSIQYSMLSLYAALGLRAVLLILAMIGVISLPVAMAFLVLLSAVSVFFTGRVK